MAEIIWAEQAIGDLHAICEFIGRDSETYAKMAAVRIIATVERLSKFPMSGRIVPELNREDVREVLAWNYRIIYRTGPASVDILTIYHGARSFPKRPETWLQDPD